MAYLFGRTRSASDLNTGSIPADQVAASVLTPHAASLEAVLNPNDMTVTAAFDMANKQITSLATPTADSDGANKSYVDSVAQGLSAKDSVRLASSNNESVVDGVALATGDRVLLKNQTSQSENGVYTVNASGAPTRALDFDASSEVEGGAFIFVEEGDQAHTGWVLTTDGTITIGSTSMAFTQFSGAGLITAGDGLSKSGNTLNIDYDSNAYHAGTTSGGFNTIGDIYMAPSTGTKMTKRTKAQAAVLLDLEIGVDVQAYDADLAAIAALTAADDKFLVGSASGWVLEDGATARASMGLIIGTHVQAYDAQLAAIAGLADGDSSFIVGSASGFVSEDAATARSSLGLSSMAIQAKEGVDIDGGAIDGTTIGATTAAAAKVTDFTMTGALVRDVYEVATAATLGAHDLVVITAASDTTVTLPASPADGRCISIKHAGGSGKTMTIAGNGKTIDGSSSVTLTEQYAAVNLFYSDQPTAAGWFVV
jgi:hypothetical protein